MNPNSATRTFSHTRAQPRQVALAIPTFPLPKLKIFGLGFAILISCLGLVYVKDLNRRAFINLQNIEQASNQLIIEHNKLLLEQSALTAPTSIQQVAQKRLNMELPQNKDILLLKQA